jgi:Rad3-related DNA helicase
MSDSFPLKHQQNEKRSSGAVGSSETQDIALMFAPDSPVARLLGGQYRPRRGQALMARLVKRALDSGQHAIVEAGTGIGKSFAYLIPLIWGGHRAFVSTANKTLQNQLWEKDLPALQRIAPHPFKAALLKGRGNYVCRLKLKELGRQMALPGQGLSIGDVLARLDETPSGDVDSLRLFGQVRTVLTADQHECLGQRCPMFAPCYYELARAQAEDADIVILNHSLLAFNLILESRIVQPRDVLVVDEAHELAGYVADALRLRLEYEQIPGFINDDIITRHADNDVRGQAVRINHELFAYLSQSNGSDNERRWALPGEVPQAQALMGQINAIRRDLAKRYPPVPGGGDANEENARHKAAMEWAAELASQLATFGQETPPDAIRYCEKGSGKSELARIVLCQEPAEVAGFLKETLWATTQTVICTSATLAANASFDYLRRQLGAPRENVIQRIIDSPFDYPRQAMLYTPHGLIPDYGAGEEAYARKLAHEVERLVTASRGRAFVLCTSLRRAEQLFEALEPRLPYTCYCQGTASRNELLDCFRDNPDGAVLFATKSFWEGVDIPGEALSLVIIDKLPFAPHRDPVIQHREQRIREAGGSPFNEYMLPEAILALKQGVGRLIRTETDRGVMAILDSRLNTKQYGARVIASLPKARRTFRFEDVAAFFMEGAE